VRNLSREERLVWLNKRFIARLERHAWGVPSLDPIRVLLDGVAVGVHRGLDRVAGQSIVEVIFAATDAQSAETQNPASFIVIRRSDTTTATWDE
jgi:hypothetical protein